MAQTLALVISDILTPYEAKGVFRVMEPRVLDTKERRARYVTMAKGLGVRYRACDLSGYKIYGGADQQGVYDRLVDITDNMPERLADGSGIILYGRPGTGKDHLLIALAYSAVLQWGFTVQWVNGASLFQEARQLIDGDESERDFIERYSTKQILIISDPIPSKGSASQYGVDVLYRILDRRYRQCLSTWATMNVHDGKEAEERLASPIVSRLKHGALCMACDWADFREPRK